MKPTHELSADELSAEIAQTRQDLGQTIDALAHKVNDSAKTGLLVLAGAVAVAVAIALIVRGRRS